MLIDKWTLFSHLSYSNFLKPPLRVCMDRARMAENLFHLCECAWLYLRSKLKNRLRPEADGRVMSGED